MHLHSVTIVENSIGLGRITAHVASSQAKEADKEVTWFKLHRWIFLKTTGDISIYV